MAIVTDARGTAESVRAGGTGRVAVEGRKAKPVKWWAVIGAGFVLVQLYVFTAWILSGPTSTPAGKSHIEGWMLFVVRFQEITSPIGMVLFFYFFLYKPWRRDGRIRLDGI